MSISPKELTAKLLGKKIVKVKSGNGDEFEFEIQKVNIEIFAGKGAAVLGKIVGKTQEEIKKMFVDKFESQEMSKIIAPVLVDGVAKPKVVDKEIYDEETEVSIKVILKDLELASNLYMEILTISATEKK